MTPAAISSSWWSSSAGRRRFKRRGEENRQSRTIFTGSRRRGEGAEGRRQVDAYTCSRAPSRADHGVGRTHRSSATARVGTLRGGQESGDRGSPSELEVGGNSERFLNNSDTGRSSKRA